MITLRIRACLFLLTVAVRSDDGVPELKQIQNYVKINDSADGHYIKSVRIHESELCDVLYTYGVPSAKNARYTLNAFYAALSCKFADWSMNKLYDFVKIYRPFSREHGPYEEPLVAKSFETLTETVNKYVGRFVSILNHILAVNSDVLYYNDTAVLEALASLKMKVNLIKFRKNGSYESDMKAAVRRLVEEMNSFQSVLSVNCSDSPASEVRDLRFFGFWITEADDVLVGVDTIDNFLFNVRKTRVDMDPADCYTERNMFLENIVKANDRISLDIVEAKVTIADTAVSIGRIMKRARTSYDIRTILLHQDYVLTVIVKLLFRKTIGVMETSKTVPGELVDKILEIHTKISKVREYLPTCLIDGFGLLATLRNNTTNDASVQRRFRNYRESLVGIEFVEQGDTTPWTQVHRVVLGRQRCECKRTFCARNHGKMTLESCSVVEVRPGSLLVDDVGYLNTLVMRFANNLDGLICFHRSLKFLRDEQDKLRVPVGPPTAFLVPYAEDDGTCDFVMNLYSICLGLNAFMTVDALKVPKQKYFYNMGNRIYGIKDYVLAVIKGNKRTDPGLRKMSYNVAIVLANLIMLTEKKVDDYHLKRILNVIMTEINRYAVSYCTSSKYDMLLYGDIKSVNGFGNDDVEKMVLTYVKNNFRIDLAKPNSINKMDYEHFSVQLLYDKFIKNSNVFKTYQDKIKFYWKGEKHSVKDIYEDAIFLNLNPRNLYIFYDIYFKFYIAVVYYEIKEILDKSNKNNIKTINEGFSKIKQQIGNFQYKYFPEKLKPFILDINALLQLTTMEQILTNKSKIEEKFRKFNIVFETFTTVQHVKKKVFAAIRSIVVSAYKQINTELSSNVSKFNELFSKL